MKRSEATLIGAVGSVTGGVIAVRLREDMPSALVFVGGESYRIGQIGAFYRIPLGRANASNSTPIVASGLIRTSE
jgi:hypothetical protein